MWPNFWLVGNILPAEIVAAFLNNNSAGDNSNLATRLACAAHSE
jgi:hypothetical protein